MLVAANCPATMRLLLSHDGVRGLASAALQLVACGRAPSWSCEETVVILMETMMMGHGMKQSSEL